MQYETFKYLVLEKLHMHFQDTRQISIQEIIKNNGRKLDGLVILEQGFNIAPTIYLDYYYMKHENGNSLSDVLDELIENYEAYRPATPIDVSFFTDFEKVKHRIVYKVVNYEKNKRLLENIPHFPFLDLAIVFYCLVHSNEGGNATILIHNQHMNRWNMTSEQLMELACINTPDLLEYELRSMESILGESAPTHILNPYPMFVLTNYSRLNGACCMLYKNLLRNIAKKMECDFFILPCSIHEVILVPTWNMSAIAELSALVKDVNGKEVSEDEVLSDHAYYYSRKNDCISM